MPASSARHAMGGASWDRFFDTTAPVAWALTTLDCLCHPAPHHRDLEPFQHSDHAHEHHERHRDHGPAADVVEAAGGGFGCMTEEPDRRHQADDVAEHRR